MDWTTNVAVHESASPEFTRERVIAKLRSGEVDPSLLYSGVRQASLWTALHQAVSPAATDPAVLAIYEAAFAASTKELPGNVAHIVSLACGSGTKDLDAIEAFRAANDRTVLYTPADFGLEMVLSAQRLLARHFRGLQCTPLLCDLVSCSVLPAILKGFDPSGAPRLILFLGTIHNYWPPDILRSILYPLRSQDRLLISANLAPEADYDPALKRITQQYDNTPTRAWLWGALSEFSLNQEDGELGFRVLDSEKLPGLKRIEAEFRLTRSREIRLFDERIQMDARASLRVFYSHRFTPRHVRTFLGQSGLVVSGEWLAPEEGLFLCQRS